MPAVHNPSSLSWNGLRHSSFPYSNVCRFQGLGQGHLQRLSLSLPQSRSRSYTRKARGQSLRKGATHKVCEKLLEARISKERCFPLWALEGSTVDF
jgi:hypothetical protein